VGGRHVDHESFAHPTPEHDNLAELPERQRQTECGRQPSPSSESDQDDDDENNKAVTVVQRSPRRTAWTALLVAVIDADTENPELSPILIPLMGAATYGREDESSDSVVELFRFFKMLHHDHIPSIVVKAVVNLGRVFEVPQALEISCR
jgi:hypothetical protein